MKKLIIFDLDGTLINTIADLAVCTNYALTACGFPVHDKDDYRFFVGNGISKLFERALPEGEKTPGNIAKIRELFIPYYNDHSADLTEPYEGIPEMLRTIQERGIALAVASNKYDVATKQLVRHYFPEIHFSAIFGNREGVPVKPDPAIAMEILCITGNTPEDTFFVGDSGVDMQTAANAGIASIGVTWGFRPREELEQFRPAHIVDSPDALLKLHGIS